MTDSGVGSSANPPHPRNRFRIEDEYEDEGDSVRTFLNQALIELVKQVQQEHRVVRLHVLHGSAHA